MSERKENAGGKAQGAEPAKKAKSADAAKKAEAAKAARAAKAEGEGGEAAQPREKRPAEPVPTPRLQSYFRETVVPQLMEKFGYKTAMQVPRIEKITLNMGVGETTT